MLDEHAFDAIQCYIMVIEHDGKELDDPCVVMVYILLLLGTILCVNSCLDDDGV